MMLARSSLEDLATRCLHEGVTAALVLSGNEPERVSWELAASIAVRMAVVIRRDVAKQLRGAAGFLVKNRRSAEQAEWLIASAAELRRNPAQFLLNHSAATGILEECLLHGLLRAEIDREAALLRIYAEPDDA